MHDIKFIRDDQAAFDAGLARRGVEKKAEAILAYDKEARRLTGVLEELQARRNRASKAIGAAKGKGDEAEAQRLMAEVDDIKAQMPATEAARDNQLGEATAILEALPNLPAPDVPDGAAEEDNAEIRRWGAPREGEALDHVDLGERTGLVDFETAAAMSGARFVVLKGPAARLERALANFMLDVHTTEFGYEEIAPPFLVRDQALYGTGQLPKFKEDLFEATSGHFLIPTAEVPLTNIVADKILDDGALPLRFTAHTPCFRSEAGSAGRDTRGMIRLHQFAKVELVSITRPQDSDAEHERMTECAEAILKRLELPYRTMLLCAGDMGFSARKTYDLEVWLPGQGRYREISSCSNCGDFQARRMKARYRPEGEKATQFVHTLNGSGLAVGRTAVALIENYQEPDGAVAVPDALVPYMGGLRKIEAGGA